MDMSVYKSCVIQASQGQVKAACVFSLVWFLWLPWSQGEPQAKSSPIIDESGSRPLSLLTTARILMS